jgi:hypothetical protein
MKKNSDRPSFRLLDLYDSFYKEVESRGIGSSTLLRDLVKDGLHPERRLAAEELAALREEVSMLRRELAPVGGNLNQLAHSFNREDPVFTISKLAEQHEQLQTLFSTLIDRLDRVRLRLR